MKTMLLITRVLLRDNITDLIVLYQSANPTKSEMRTRFLICASYPQTCRLTYLYYGFAYQPKSLVML